MNRLILRYAYPITVVILAVFAWVVIQRISRGWSEVIPLAITAGIVWVIGTVVFIYFWPRLTADGFKRAITRRGFGGGPIPVNTLYAEPSTSSPDAPVASLLATGTDRVLYVAGWLDLRRGPQILHVPDMADRYYSVQLIDPGSGANFAYVGTRTTGNAAGRYLITGAGWEETVATGMTRIPMPARSVLVIGRVGVSGDEDRPHAFALAREIQLTPQSS